MRQRQPDIFPPDRTFSTPTVTWNGNRRPTPVNSGATETTSGGMTSIRRLSLDHITANGMGFPRMPLNRAMGSIPF